MRKYSSYVYEKNKCNYSKELTIDNGKSTLVESEVKEDEDSDEPLLVKSNLINGSKTPIESYHIGAFDDNGLPAVKNYMNGYVEECRYIPFSTDTSYSKVTDPNGFTESEYEAKDVKVPDCHDMVFSDINEIVNVDGNKSNIHTKVTMITGCDSYTINISQDCSSKNKSYTDKSISTLVFDKKNGYLESEILYGSDGKMSVEKFRTTLYDVHGNKIDSDYQLDKYFLTEYFGNDPIVVIEESDNIKRKVLFAHDRSISGDVIPLYIGKYYKDKGQNSSVLYEYTNGIEAPTKIITPRSYLEKEYDKFDRVVMQKEITDTVEADFLYSSAFRQLSNKYPEFIKL